MKFLKSNVWILTAIVAITLFSCQRSDFNGDTSNANINLSVTETTNKSITVKATPDKVIGNYYIGLCTAERYADEFASDPLALAEGLIIDEKDKYNTDFSDADTIWIFKGENTVDLSFAWEIEQLTDYVIAAFGVEANGEVCTQVAVATTTTEETIKEYEDGDLIVHVDRCGANNIVLSVDTDGYNGNYFLGCYPELQYQDEFGGDKLALAQSLIDYEKTNQTDFGYVDDRYIFSGNQTIDVNQGWRLNPETDYVFPMICVDYDGNIQGEVTLVMASTIELSASTETVDISISDIVNRTVTVTYTPSAKDIEYIFGVYEASVVESLFGTEDDFVNILQYLVEDDDIGCGDVVDEVKELKVNTRYYAIALYVDGKVPASDLFKYEFMTGDGGSHSENDPEPIDRVLEAKVTSTTYHGINLDVEVGDYTGNYYVGIYEKANYEADPIAGNADNLAQAFINMEINDYATDLSKVDNIWMFRGDSHIDTSEAWGHRPDTDYVVAIFGVGEYGAILSKVNILEAHTEQVVPISGVLELDVVKTTHNDIILSVDPKGYTGNYYVASCEKSTLESIYNSDINEFVTKLIDSERGFNLSTPDDKWIYNGAQDSLSVSNGWSILPRKDYVVAVFGIDSYGNGVITTDISCIEASSIDVTYKDFSVDFEVSNLTSKTVDVTFKPSDNDTPYLYAMLQADSFDKATGTEMELMTTIVGTVIGDEPIMSGENTKTFQGMTPGERYYVVSFAIDSEKYTPLSHMSKIEVTAALTDSKSFTAPSSNAINAVRSLTFNSPNKPTLKKPEAQKNTFTSKRK